MTLQIRVIFGVISPINANELNLSPNNITQIFFPLNHLVFKRTKYSQIMLSAIQQKNESSFCACRMYNL